MGGEYYERGVQQAGEYEEYSDQSNQLFLQNNSLHKSLDPKRFLDQSLSSKHKTPIIFALDVTGSMGDWSKVSKKSFIFLIISFINRSFMTNCLCFMVN